MASYKGDGINHSIKFGTTMGTDVKHTKEKISKFKKLCKINVAEDYSQDRQKYGK